MARNVRMADIAEKLGISIVSVSKGLSGKDGVSEELRARILRTAEEMGYQVPRVQTDIQSGGSVAVLVPDRAFDNSTFYAKLYRELLEACKRRGMLVMMEIVTNESERSLARPAVLEEGRASGLIFMGEFFSDYVKSMEIYGLPYLLLDFYLDDHAADSVNSDNVHGAYVLTDRLIQRGYTRIGFVGSILSTSSIMDRYLGHCKALYRHGMKPREDWRMEDRDGEGKFIPLTLPIEMPQAFVCSCDEVAFNLIELLRERGFRVPGDVAVTGYDDFRFATLSHPNLTTWQVDIAGMAEAAALILSKRMMKRNVETPMQAVSGHLVARGSD